MGFFALGMPRGLPGLLQVEKRRNQSPNLVCLTKVPTQEEFDREMEVLLSRSMTFVVEKRMTGEAIGFTQAYNVNPAEGWAYVLIYTIPSHRRGYGAEAFAALLD